MEKTAGQQVHGSGMIPDEQRITGQERGGERRAKEDNTKNRVEDRDVDRLHGGNAG